MREELSETGRDEENTLEAEQERARRRRERIQRMKREKERRMRLNSILKTALPVAAFVLAVGIVFFVRAVSVKGTEGTGKTPEDVAQEDLSVRGETAESERKASDGGGGTEEPQGVPETGESNEGALALGGDETDAESPDMAEMPSGEASGESVGMSEASAAEDTAPTKSYSAHMTPRTDAPPEEVNSPYAIFIDLESGDILAGRDHRARISPASMTKVLTVLVAAEHAADLDEKFTITRDITDYSYSNGCSSVGFDVGETVTVRDLFYGTILPSGGDAAVALATYVAGSHEAFVEMMNEKAKALGLGETAHFANCVGLYDEMHYCTVYDMAMIMEAALDNELCREVLNAHFYTTSQTSQHPEGIPVSNLFLRRIEDKDTGGEVLCAKTGYVVQSDSCAVSYGVDKSGREYLCVTAGAYSSWRCIYDHVALYKKYAKEQT